MELQASKALFDDLRVAMRSACARDLRDKTLAFYGADTWALIDHQDDTPPKPSILVPLNPFLDTLQRNFRSIDDPMPAQMGLFPEHSEPANSVVAKKANRQMRSRTSGPKSRALA